MSAVYRMLNGAAGVIGGVSGTAEHADAMRQCRLRWRRLRTGCQPLRARPGRGQSAATVLQNSAALSMRSTSAW